MEALALLNVPHPSRGVMKAAIRRRPRQPLMGWYVFAFQLPVLPEWILRWRNWRILAANLRRSTPESITREDQDRYRDGRLVIGGVSVPVSVLADLQARPDHLTSTARAAWPARGRGRRGRRPPEGSPPEGPTALHARPRARQRRCGR
jgi:hypothetical protein